MKKIKAWGMLYPYETRRLKAYKNNPFQMIFLNESVAHGERTKGTKVIPVTISFKVPKARNKKKI